MARVAWLLEILARTPPARLGFVLMALAVAIAVSAALAPRR